MSAAGTAAGTGCERRRRQTHKTHRRRCPPRAGGPVRGTHPCTCGGKEKQTGRASALETGERGSGGRGGGTSTCALPRSPSYSWREPARRGWRPSATHCWTAWRRWWCDWSASRLLCSRRYSDLAGRRSMLRPAPLLQVPGERVRQRGDGLDSIRITSEQPQVGRSADPQGVLFVSTPPVMEGSQITVGTMDEWGARGCPIPFTPAGRSHVAAAIGYSAGGTPSCTVDCRRVTRSTNAWPPKNTRLHTQRGRAAGPARGSPLLVGSRGGGGTRRAPPYDTRHQTGLWSGPPPAPGFSTAFLPSCPARRCERGGGAAARLGIPPPFPGYGHQWMVATCAGLMFRLGWGRAARPPQPRVAPRGGRATGRARARSRRRNPHGACGVDTARRGGGSSSRRCQPCRHSHRHQQPPPTDVRRPSRAS